MTRHEEVARGIAHHIVKAYGREWASQPISGHDFRAVDKHALTLAIAAEVATALREAEAAGAARENEACARLAERYNDAPAGVDRSPTAIASTIRRFAPDRSRQSPEGPLANQRAEK